MDWNLDNIVIVAGIVFFILSAFGKIGKNNEESKQNRMPTFGGGGDLTERVPKSNKEELSGQQARRVKSLPATEASAGQSADDRTYDSFDDEEQYPAYHEESERTYSSPADLESWHDAAPGRESTLSLDMEQRNRYVEEGLDQIHKELDKITSHIPEISVEVTDTGGTSGRNQSNLVEQARRGVIWSEILGPPRSKKPLRRRY